METKKIILLIVGLFLINLVYALGPPPMPPLPNHFTGDVTINGQNAPIGTPISIYVDSTPEGTVLTTIVGEYDLDVRTGSTDDVIEFKIQNILAGSGIRSWGETILLDLSITTAPSSPPPSSGGGGGGSGGGGGGIISPPQPQAAETGGSSSGSEENTTQTRETKEQEATNTAGMTGAVIGFLESGKGTAAIVIVIILVIGVILIKFGPQKWKKSSS
ncbi:MAG TPA: hypothetical protein ENH99_02360 [Candidatus Pacearchaeota archaeon]|nr:hypothetical protein [Candidatus Pacearchaeota archaeon]